MTSQIDITLAQPVLTLRLGLLDPTVTGNGFSSLTFTVTDGGNVVESASFSSSAAADAFFTDNVLSFSGSSDNLILSMTMTTLQAGDGFAFNAEVAAVPEPSTIWLVSLGLCALPLFRRKSWITLAKRS